MPAAFEWRPWLRNTDIYIVIELAGSNDYGASQWKGLSDLILLGVVAIGKDTS